MPSTESVFISSGLLDVLGKYEESYSSLACQTCTASGPEVLPTQARPQVFTWYWSGT